MPERFPLISQGKCSTMNVNECFKEGWNSLFSVPGAGGGVSQSS